MKTTKLKVERVKQSLKAQNKDDSVIARTFRIPVELSDEMRRVTDMCDGAMSETQILVIAVRVGLVYVREKVIPTLRGEGAEI